jgi:flagellar hook assembly protein FlgD
MKLHILILILCILYMAVTCMATDSGLSMQSSNTVQEPTLKSYPNPFNPTTTIFIELPVARLVTVNIYNVLGQRVKSLVNGDLSAGSNSITWNGTNDSGLAVASGTYLVHMDTGTYNSVMKIILLK